MRVRRQLSSPAFGEAPRIRSGIPVGYPLRGIRTTAPASHGSSSRLPAFRSWCIDVVISAGTLSTKSRRCRKSAGRSTPRASAGR